MLDLCGNEPKTLGQNQGVDSINTNETLPDAMDKVVEHLDNCPTGQLNVLDAMDSILEPPQSNQVPVLYVEMITPIPDNKLVPALRVETKPCSVNLTHLEIVEYWIRFE